MSLTGIGEVADLATSVLNKFFPDKTEQEKAQMAMALAVLQGTMDTNKAEAASTSMFVAGWRPAVGWVCAAAFGMQYFIGPFAQWAAALAGKTLVFPVMDLSTMMPILLGMLGLGAARTVEKVVGGVNAGH